MENKTKRKRAKNPLYVVTGKGKVVEEATSPVEALLKRLGLNGFVETLMEMIKALLSSVENYAMLVAVKNFYESLMVRLMDFLGALGFKIQKEA